MSCRVLDEVEDVDLHLPVSVFQHGVEKLEYLIHRVDVIGGCELSEAADGDVGLVVEALEALVSAELLHVESV